MSNEELIERALKKCKLRRTPVRAGVLEVLAKAVRPMGAVEILEKLPSGTDTVTVYRTLNTFTGKKLVHRVRGEDRTWRYALTAKAPAARRAEPHADDHPCGDRPPGRDPDDLVRPAGRAGEGEQAGQLAVEGRVDGSGTRGEPGRALLRGVDARGVGSRGQDSDDHRVRRGARGGSAEQVQLGHRGSCRVRRAGCPAAGRKFRRQGNAADG